MKKNYYDPEMKISTFSFEDVVTTSGGIHSEVGQYAYDRIVNADGVQKQEITLGDIQSHYVDMTG